MDENGWTPSLIFPGRGFTVNTECSRIRPHSKWYTDACIWGVTHPDSRQNIPCNLLNRLKWENYQKARCHGHGMIWLFVHFQVWFESILFVYKFTKVLSTLFICFICTLTVTFVSLDVLSALVCIHFLLCVVCCAHLFLYHLFCVLSKGGNRKWARQFMHMNWALIKNDEYKAEKRCQQTTKWKKKRKHTLQIK